MDVATASVIGSIGTLIGAVTVALINKSSNKNKNVRTDEEKNSPKSHYFFAKMNYFLTSIIPNMKTCPGISALKCEMLKKFLYIKFSIFKKGMEKWVERDDEVRLDDLIKYIMTLIDEYEREAGQAGVPRMFIESFAREHQPVVDATLQCIEQIMRCGSYDNTDKENAVLDTLMHSFIMTAVSAERTAMSMNGQLDNYLSTYKKE